MRRCLSFRTFALTSVIVLVCHTLIYAEPHDATGQVRLRYERSRAEVGERLRTQKVELMKLMVVDNPNPEHIKRKLGQIMRTEEERQSLFIDEVFAVRSTMTESQWRDYRRAILFKMMERSNR